VKWYVQAGAAHRRHSRSTPAPITFFYKKMETDMCGSESRKELALMSSASGCSCCSTQVPEESLATAGAAEYALEGLTCGHCVETVRKAVTAADGVNAASVELVAGGRSRLVVSGSAVDAAVRDAVTSAGYSLIPS
jgi:copper chaperone